MGATIIKVFVSSTWSDLQPERKAIENVLQRLRHTKFVGMEYFGSRDENTQNVSLGEVDQCDLYVGIFGGRYGSGITEAEYQKASKLSLPCFIYFKEEACIPSDLWENVPDKAERLKALKNALCQNHTITIFTTPDDLATKLTADLHNWFFDMYIVQGIESFHKVYAARIQNFMNEYLGTLKHPVPFGGRNIDLSLLDKWFDGPEQPPYLLLSAPAGRGKSAMLARWSKQLSRRDNVEVVFFPVSIRFRTNLASIVFSSMTARLSLLYGTPVSVLPDITIEMWRGMMTEFLSRPFPDGRTLLLILDGVDEAADWEPGPDLFPSSPGKGVHVIVSARYLAGDVDSSGWMHRLGWHHQNLASSMDLSPLTQEGVADALNSMGFPLDQLGRRVDIIAELHRLSEGDPLLVRLYVDDLLVGGDSTARLQPEDLYSIHPGLEGYFDRWWKDQVQQWGRQNPLREQEAQTLLGLMSGALGPLSQDDLLYLMPPERRLTSLSLSEALCPLSRFIMGDGRTLGYTFSHPRLGDYFYSRLTKAEQKAVQSRFIDYGRDTLSGLRQKSIQPADASTYIVQHYGAHIEKAASDAETFLSLVCDEWRQAWYNIEGTYSGFLNDVVRARAAAERANCLLVQQKLPAKYIGGEVRCALCQSSIRTMASNIPSDLLLALVAGQVLSPIQGLGYARLISDVKRCVETTAGLMQYLPANIQMDLSSELIEAARSIEDEYSHRTDTLKKIMPLLPEPLKVEALEIMRISMDKAHFTDSLVNAAPYLPEQYRIEAFDALCIDDTTDHVYQLTQLMAYLSEPQKSHALSKARESAAAITDAAKRSRAMLLLLPWLAEDERNDAASVALNDFQDINDRTKKIHGWTDCAVHLTGSQRYELLQRSLQMSRQMSRSGLLDEKSLISVQAHMAPHLPDPLKEEILSDLLTRVSRVKKEDRWQLVAQLAPHLPEGLMETAMNIAIDLPDEGHRASLLIALAPCLPNYLRESLLIEAQKMPQYELSILMKLIPFLPSGLLTDFHQSAFSRARAINYGPSRITALVELAPFLPDALKRQALIEAMNAAQFIRDRDHQAAAIASISMHIPDSSAGVIVNESLSLIADEARNSNISIELIDTLTRAGLRLRDSERTQIFDGLFKVIHTFNDAYSQLKAIIILLPYIPPSHRDNEFNGPLNVLITEKSGQPLAFELAELSVAVPYLSQLTRNRVLGLAIKAARGVSFPGEKEKFLSKLVKFLPCIQRRKIVNEALTAAFERGSGFTGSDRTQVNVLKTLVPYIPFWQRKRVLRKALKEIGAYMNRQNSCVALVSSFVPYLSSRVKKKLLAEALSTARTIINNPPYFRSNSEAETMQENVKNEAETLILLIPHLPRNLAANVCNEALALARRLQKQISRFSLLGKLVPHLSKPSGDEVMAEAVAIAEVLSPSEKGWDFGCLLAELVPYMSDDLLARSLGVALSIHDGHARLNVLAALSPRLEAITSPGRLLALWHDALPIIAKRNRKDLLDDLSKLHGVIAKLGNSCAVCDTYLAIQEVCRWWL